MTSYAARRNSLSRANVDHDSHHVRRLRLLRCNPGLLHGVRGPDDVVRGPDDVVRADDGLRRRPIVRGLRRADAARAERRDHRRSEDPGYGYVDQAGRPAEAHARSSVRGAEEDAERGVRAQHRDDQGPGEHAALPAAGGLGAVIQAAYDGHHAAGGADVCSGQAIRAPGGDAEELDECVRWYLQHRYEEEQPDQEAVGSSTTSIYGGGRKVGLWRRVQVSNSSCDRVWFNGSII